MRPHHITLRNVGDTLLVVVALATDLVMWGGDTRLRAGGNIPFAIVPLVSVGVYSLLKLRWRYPTTVFAGHLVYGMTGLLLPGYGPLAGLLVALHAVARGCRRLIAVVALIACAIPLSVDCWNGANQRVHTEVDLWVSFTGQFFLNVILVTAVWSLGRLSYAADQRSVRALAQQAAKSAAAVEAERLRLARELHDIVSHAVTTMLLQAAGARNLVNASDDRVGVALGVIESSGVQAMRELHRLLLLLRTVDASPDDATAQPGINDLGTLLTLARRTGVQVTMHERGTPRPLDSSVGLAAYRVIQEGLTNVIKHGGQDATTDVLLDWHADCLALSVQNTVGTQHQLGVDRGQTTTLSAGYGLAGLSERVALLGGRLEAGDAPNGGFRVAAELPVNESASLPRLDADALS